jgi:hypothetical protein
LPELDKRFLRKLADWRANGAPVSSLYPGEQDIGALLRY